MAGASKDEDAMKKAMKAAKLSQATKDDTLCKAIVKVLEENGPQRVLLAGEAGIGKTRMAKMVGKYVTDNRHCFLTICVHLNKKFVDELSLYENIASQLCVYSDFEETEVDDRDEDEDDVKSAKDLLTDLKKKISEEIERKKKAADNEKAAADKKKKEAEDKAANNAKEPGSKNTTAAGKLAGTNPAEEEKKDTPFTGQPYLLLILDDEGITVTNGEEATNEDKVTNAEEATNENKDIVKEEVTNEDKDIVKEEVTNEDKDTVQKEAIVKAKVISEVTNEDWVMRELKFEEFLRGQKFLIDDNNRLKIITTERKGDKEPTKTDEKAESTKAKSEEGDGSHSEERKKDNENDSQEDIKPLDIVNVGNPVPEVTDSALVTKSDGDVASLFEVSTKCYDEIGFTTTDASKALRATIDEANLKDLFFSLVKEEWKTDEDLRKKIVTKSRNSPATIFVLAKSLVVLAKSLERITQSTSDSKEIKEVKIKELQEKIDKKIREVLSVEPTSHNASNPILYLAYELLEFYDDRLKDAILDCFWHSLDFFEHCGCVYYRDLITQWILEGYFDPVRSVEKAHEDGHLILMELINRGMLKIQENNVVVPERAMSNLIDPRRDGLFKRSRLRFSKVYRGDKKKGLGKISQIDDMIKTVQAKKGDNISTILVGGDRLRRETPEKYFKKLDHLEVLGLFEPTLDPFVPALTKLTERSPPKDTTEKPVELRVLVIRDCDLLKEIHELTMFGQLNVLEVSGASSVEEIPHEFFSGMSELQSLHLSGLQITYSPSSITLLKKLHCLIIKDCPLLKDLPDIQELRELEVVDISGAHGLQTCFDNTPGNKKNKSKNKNFYHLTKLQLLDFSESQIERLPIFQDAAKGEPLRCVTRLLLRNCRKLRRLPSLKPLSGLQILDLSGTTSLVEMLEVCFEEKRELKSLNLSGTNLSELATTIDELTGLTNLLLKDCTNLDVIPNISKLESLEVIDVSGSSKLHTIEGSFVEMPYLREVNLFGTKVKTPELPTESKIVCQKSITLADGTCFKGKDWDEVKAKMPSQGPKEASSSSGAVVTSEEITEMKSEEASSSGAVVTSKIQSNEPLTSVCTENGDVTKERLLQVPIERTLYRKTLDYFKPASQPEIMEINETNVIDEAALANVEFISFMDCSSKRLTSIFNKTKSVKGCWLRMCTDIKDLFSAVAEVHPAVVEVHPAVDVERLELLETLSITNLPLLESISGGGSLKNLKKLTIECCPKVKTLFPEASQVPSSLKDLNVKYCEKLEKVAEGVELSAYTSPEGEENSVDSDWVVLDHSDADAPPQG